MVMAAREGRNRKWEENEAARKALEKEFMSEESSDDEHKQVTEAVRVRLEELGWDMKDHRRTRQLQQGIQDE